MTRIVAAAVALARKKLADRRQHRALKLELSKANSRIAELEVTVRGLEFQLEDVKRVNRRLAARVVDQRVEGKCHKATHSVE